MAAPPLPPSWPAWISDTLKSIDFGQVLLACISAASVMVGAAFTFIVARKKAKSDVQGTLNQGFTVLINEFQEERAALMLRINEQDKRLDAMITRMRLLERILSDNGIAIPN